MDFNNFGNNYAFKHANDQSMNYVSSEVATKKGIGTKTIFLLLLTFISAVVMMLNVDRFNDLGMGLYGFVFIVNFVLQLIICFVPSTTKVLSIPYAICEGLLIGVLVGILEYAIPGLGFQIASLALVMTVAIFFAASILYTTGLIKVTNKLRTFLFVSLLGMLLGSLAVGIMSFFSPSIALFFNSFEVSLVVSIIFVVLAGFYVTMSLDNANRIAEGGFSKEYEWFAAYGILINIVWLFLEVFRLLLILAARNRD